MARLRLYDFEVKGAVPFPLDMLRYDECWPVGDESIHNIAQAEDKDGFKMRRVRLRSYRQPTGGRWRSFLWVVVEGA